MVHQDRREDRLRDRERSGGTRTRNNRQYRSPARTSETRDRDSRSRGGNKQGTPHQEYLTIREERPQETPTDGNKHKEFANTCACGKPDDVSECMACYHLACKCCRGSCAKCKGEVCRYCGFVCSGHPSTMLCADCISPCTVCNSMVCEACVCSHQEAGGLVCKFCRRKEGVPSCDMCRPPANTLPTSKAESSIKQKGDAPNYMSPKSNAVSLEVSRDLRSPTRPRTPSPSNRGVSNSTGQREGTDRTRSLRNYGDKERRTSIPDPDTSKTKRTSVNHVADSLNRGEFVRDIQDSNFANHNNTNRPSSPVRQRPRGRSPRRTSPVRSKQPRSPHAKPSYIHGTSTLQTTPAPHHKSSPSQLMSPHSSALRDSVTFSQNATIGVSPSKAPSVSERPFLPRDPSYTGHSTSHAVPTYREPNRSAPQGTSGRSHTSVVIDFPAQFVFVSPPSSPMSPFAEPHSPPSSPLSPDRECLPSPPLTDVGHSPRLSPEAPSVLTSFAKEFPIIDRLQGYFTYQPDLMPDGAQNTQTTPPPRRFSPAHASLPPQSLEFKQHIRGARDRDSSREPSRNRDKERDSRGKRRRPDMHEDGNRDRSRDDKDRSKDRLIITPQLYGINSRKRDRDIAAYIHESDTTPNRNSDIGNNKRRKGRR